MALFASDMSPSTIPGGRHGLLSPMRSWLEPAAVKTSLTPSQKALVQKSGRLLIAGRAEDALRLCDEALESILNVDREEEGTVAVDASELSRLYVLRAQANSRLGNISESSLDLERSLRLDKNHPEALNTRAMHRLDLNDISGALEDVNKAIEISPNSPRFYSTRSAIYMTAGDIRSAREDCDAILSLDPTLAEAYANRAVCHCLDSPPSLSLALLDINNAIDFDPCNASLFRVRAGVMVLLDRKDNAIADLDRAVSLRPADLSLRKKRADLYKNLGDAAPALEDYSVILKHNPDDIHSLRNRADIYVEMDRASDAIADYGRLIQLLPDCPLIWANYARVQFQNQQIEDCIKRAKHSLSLPDPITVEDRDNARYIANSFLGLAAVQQGRVDDACKYFTNALAIVPDAISVRANRAQCLAELGKHPEAIREFSKILKVEAYAEIYLQRARSKQALGQLDGAIADVNQSIALDASSTGLLVARAIIYDQQGKIEEAIKDCDAALKLDPYDISAKQLLRTLETRKTQSHPASKRRRVRPGDDVSVDSSAG